MMKTPWHWRDERTLVSRWGHVVLRTADPVPADRRDQIVSAVNACTDLADPETTVARIMAELEHIRDLICHHTGEESSIVTSETALDQICREVSQLLKEIHHP